MTALDGYAVFAICFAIFALWVVHEAKAAIKRLRENAKKDEDTETSDASGASTEDGPDR